MTLTSPEKYPIEVIIPAGTIIETKDPGGTAVTIKETTERTMMGSLRASMVGFGGVVLDDARVVIVKLEDLELVSHD